MVSAALASTGNTAVAKLAPTTLTGTIERLVARKNCETDPSWIVVAMTVSTSRLSWTIPTPMVVGIISQKIRRTFLSRQSKLGRYRKLVRAAANSWISICRNAPKTTP